MGAHQEGSGHDYWPYYCEENIWHLCGAPEAQGDERLVALISNPTREVAVWHQKAARLPDEPVIWDYHVVLLVRHGNQWRVWDLDSVLGVPLDVEQWLVASFAGTAQLPESFAPYFRILPADQYRQELATDRRHMRRPDGTWVSPPPPWPTIGEGSNLAQLIDMGQAHQGSVVDLDGLWSRLRPRVNP